MNITITLPILLLSHLLNSANATLEVPSVSSSAEQTNTNNVATTTNANTVDVTTTTTTTTTTPTANVNGTPNVTPGVAVSATISVNQPDVATETVPAAPVQEQPTVVLEPAAEVVDAEIGGVEDLLTNNAHPPSNIFDEEDDDEVPDHNLKTETDTVSRKSVKKRKTKKTCKSCNRVEKSDDEENPPPCECGMTGYFIFNTKTRLLLKDLKTETAFHYYVALVSIFVISLFPYMLKTLRTILIIKINKNSNRVKSTISMIISLFLSLPIITIDYGLMLIAMTFNVGYFFAIIGGLSLGYTIFGHLLDAPCHCKRTTLPSDCCS